MTEHSFKRGWADVFGNSNEIL
jgi:hypothetical protein